MAKLVHLAVHLPPSALRMAEHWVERCFQRVDLLKLQVLDLLPF